MDKRCIGAFVTFNHIESYMRARRAYAGSTHWFTRLFQPTNLRFQNYFDLRVVPAPDPSDVRPPPMHLPRLCLRTACAYLSMFVLVPPFFGWVLER